ncbi:MAG: DNA repair protein RecN [Sphaerochaetaceae bacterium]|nr:DNA repair protein RecN [Spirochaetales bacterium]MDY5500723.1 DNA repair protein RecN [Sphaerochaetaceae bacterium]
MLERLAIRHYALIEDAEISFSDGLSAITGETGAGKSIILGALSLLLGDKASNEVIRAGHDCATVSGTFHFDHVPQMLQDMLDAMDLELDDGDIVVSRTVRSNGRSTCSVQGTARTRAELARLGLVLVDISAQRDHQSLFLPTKQREVLDSASGDEKELAAYQAAWKELEMLRSSYEELSSLVAASKREQDYLAFAVSEIEKIRVRPGEDEQIARQIEVIGSYEQIHDHVEEAVRRLHEDMDGNSTLEGLRAATKETAEASRSDERLVSLSSRLESCAIECQDIYETLRDYLDHMSFSQEKLDQLQGRQSYLKRLMKKYGPTLDDVIRYHAEAKSKLEAGTHGEERLAELSEKIKRSRKMLQEKALALSTARKKAAVKLGKEVEQVLQGLGMAQATFAIRVTSTECGPSGADEVSFDICANPGLESRPISQVASGGELSRILLALTAVLKADDVPGTLVFDEIDSGIGGAVAVAVGQELTRLKQSHQVIAITHLASIAAMADNQLVVSKKVEKGLSFSSIRPVEGEDRVREIARMLSGDTGEVTLMHARSLLRSSAL